MHPLRERIRLELADAFLAKNRVSSALDILEKGLSLHPDSPVLSLRLGLIYSQLKDYETAEKHLTRVVLTRGETSDLLTVKADAAFALAVQAIQIGEVEAFRRFLEETFHWKPDHKEARLFAASAALRQGNLEGTAEHLQFLIQLPFEDQLPTGEWIRELPFPDGQILAAGLFDKAGWAERGRCLLQLALAKAKDADKAEWILRLETALGALGD